MFISGDLHGYFDRGRVGERVAVCVQYTYCHSYCDLHGYSDRGGVGERVAVRVQYTYCHSYCVLHGHSDRGGHAHCVWLLCHVIVIRCMCVCRGDTRTWTVHAHPLCQSYYGCPKGTVTKHGSTGHPSAKGKKLVEWSDSWIIWRNMVV